MDAVARLFAMTGNISWAPDILGDPKPTWGEALTKSLQGKTKLKGANYPGADRPMGRPENLGIGGRRAPYSVTRAGVYQPWYGAVLRPRQRAAARVAAADVDRPQYHANRWMAMSNNVAGKQRLLGKSRMRQRGASTVFNAQWGQRRVESSSTNAGYGSFDVAARARTTAKDIGYGDAVLSPSPAAKWIKETGRAGTWDEV